MTMNKGGNMKVHRPRMSLRKLIPSSPSQRLKAILPVLIKLQNIQDFTHNEIMDILGHITDKNSHRILTPVEKGELSKYLEKYGYNSDWMESEVETI